MKINAAIYLFHIIRALTAGITGRLSAVIYSIRTHCLNLIATKTTKGLQGKEKAITSAGRSTRPTTPRKEPRLIETATHVER